MDEYLGDGVYAHFDNFGIEIRVNDHRAPVAVYFEPDTIASFIKFTERCCSKPTPETSDQLNGTETP